jgi:hypothetical protein
LKKGAGKDPLVLCVAKIRSMTEPQTVRSLVLPPIRMTPLSLSDRISPSVEALSGVK